MKLLDFEGVGFGYSGQAPILSGVNFAVNRGDKILILGPNGSGKSTFALLAAGILTPQVGEIKTAFINDSGIRTGIVFQDSRMQMVGTTVEDDLAFGLSVLNYPAPEIKKLVDQYLDLFGLNSKRHHGAAQLSGGELRRLALAAVMITNPDLIILDEPLAMLDFAGQRSFLSLLETPLFADTGLIWLDHDLRHARYLKQWYVLKPTGFLETLTLTQLNSEEFLKANKLMPTPLQPLEWEYPGLVRKAIFGPEEIEILDVNS